MRAVAVMHVPVHDQDAGGARRLGRPRGDRDVVEEAKAHGQVRFGVVAGGANEGKTVLEVSLDEERRELRDAPGGQHGGLRRVPARVCVGVELREVAPGRRLDRVDQPLRVDRSQLPRCRLARGHARAAFEEAFRDQLGTDRFESPRMLRVLVRRPVKEEAVVVQETRGHERSLRSKSRV